MTAAGPDERLLCLVTGATGYVGGRLVPELLAAGFRVRCLVRGAARLRDHPWAGDVEMVDGDASNPDDLDRALELLAERRAKGPPPKKTKRVAGKR